VVTASVSATGAVTGYQWYKGTSPVVSQTTATLSIASAQASDAGGYSVAILSDCGSVTSTVFSLSVNTTLGIIAQPAASSVVCVGGAVSVAVSATGTGQTYQWYKAGVSLGSAGTAASLSFASVSVADAGSYSVVVTGSCSSVTSTAFSLSVEVPASTASLSSGTLTCDIPSVTLTATAANATSFTLLNNGATNATGQFAVSTPGSYTVRAGTGTACPTQVASATVSGNTGKPTATLQANVSRFCPGTSVTLTAGTDIGVSFAFSGPGLSQNSASNTASITQGGVFTVVVSGPNGCTLGTTTSVTALSNTVALGNVAPVGYYCENKLVQLPVSLTGMPNSLQWYQNPAVAGQARQVVSGQTSATLTLANVQASQAGSYVLVATADCNSATTTAHKLNVNTVIPNVVITLPSGSSVAVTGQYPTITLPPGGTANMLITGGNYFDWTLVIDRINGFEIRQHEENTTGFFQINRAGPYRLKVSNNGCEKTVEGQIVIRP
jgi:hypothetical protein